MASFSFRPILLTFAFLACKVRKVKRRVKREWKMAVLEERARIDKRMRRF